jgi:hypothetical protein
MTLYQLYAKHSAATRNLVAAARGKLAFLFASVNPFC